jgi:hypothetical protein
MEVLKRGSESKAVMALGLDKPIGLLCAVSVVICEDVLPDGAWRDVLAAFDQVQSPPALCGTTWSGRRSQDRDRGFNCPKTAISAPFWATINSRPGKTLAFQTCVESPKRPEVGPALAL